MNTTETNHRSDDANTVEPRAPRRRVSFPALLIACLALFALVACEAKKEDEASNKEESTASAEGAEGDEGAEEGATPDEGGSDEAASDDEAGAAHADGEHAGAHMAAGDDEAGAKLVAQPDAKVGDKTLCPIMTDNEFEITESSPSYEHEGKKVYFCCAGCSDKFAEDPEGHLAKHQEQVAEKNAAH